MGRWGLFGRRARARWLHLIVGGALFMPFWLLASVLVAPLTESGALFAASFSDQLVAYALGLPLAAVAGLAAPVRPLSVAAARGLCGLPDESFADGPARSRAARLRAAAWFVLHTGAGALISGATLALPPLAVTLVLVPLLPAARSGMKVPDHPVWVFALSPVAGAALLIALAAGVAAAGRGMARAAAVLLGPTPADRLAAAERRATELAERNRLARELHDSVGHALSAVTLQAGAARRLLDRDPEFVREALADIEETARRTVGELDTVLGLLRDGDPPGGVRGPTLADLDGLLARGGVPVTPERSGDPAAVPAPVSREAYRIVQEGLSNVLRHAGPVPVSLSIAVDGEKVEITMENPLPDRPPVVRPGGGRGLRGVTERAVLLGGVSEAGARERDGVWRLYAALPLAGAPGRKGGGR
ncbi:sensor histidine kinase [Streptomyces sp. NPDC058953]|uniref:sensor histidine kinase n=1 Tax=unclassified Streptomyces TaxID=2593676 RepID=UPI0036BC81D1